MVKILGLMTCFNRREKTMASIKHLIDGNPTLCFDFMIADDNSSDGTPKELGAIDNVTVLHGDGKLFYSGGMRLAMGEALATEKKYDYALLFNDDVEFFDHSIEILAEKKDDRIWVGPTCDDQQKLSYGGVIKKSKIRPAFRIVKGFDEKGTSCDTFNANCVLIPWEIFKSIGNMDSAYSHSLGDFDYGFTAVRKGYEIRVIDSYVGICCDNPRNGSWRDIALPRKERLKKKESPKGLPRKEWFHYLKKNYSLPIAIVYSIIPYVRILLKW